MAAPFMDFDASAVEVGGDKPTFKLAGRTWTCRPPRKLKAYVIGDLMKAIGSADTLDQGVLALMANMEWLFSKILVKGDREDFFKLLRDDLGVDDENQPVEDEDESDDPVITYDQMVNVMSWILETYLGNLGGRLSNSAGGRSSTGNSSKVTPLHPESS